MSVYAEAKGFRETARQLSKKLREEGFAMSHDERSKLIKDIEWYEDEAAFCDGVMRAEARQEEDDAEQDALDYAGSFDPDPED